MGFALGFFASDFFVLFLGGVVFFIFVRVFFLYVYSVFFGDNGINISSKQQLLHHFPH